MSLIFHAIEKTPWAMTEEALRTIVAVANRRGDIEALEKSLGRRPENAYQAAIRNGVGILPVRGPLFKRANLMMEISGATSYELLLRDFHELLNSPEVKAVVFDIDSPGGEANGCAELSEHIFAARGKKPLLAYIGGTGASAAYWIASACDQIFASETGIIGSIGVQTVLRAAETEGELRFVSSQSPKKNQDPSTLEGAAEVQRTIDHLADVFINKVARNRGVTREHVLQHFGQGAVFVGEKALSQGLIDSLSTFEEVITVSQPKIDITPSYIAEHYPEISAHFMELGAEGAKMRLSEAISQERSRISTIRSLAEGEVSEEFCQNLINQGVSLSEAALSILLEAKKSGRKTRSEDPRVRFDESLSGIDVPPPEGHSSALASLRGALDLAKKSGLNVRG